MSAKLYRASSPQQATGFPPMATVRYFYYDNNGNINITTRDARFVKILNDMTEKQELINNNVIDHEFLDIWAQYLSDKLKN